MSALFVGKTLSGVPVSLRNHIPAHPFSPFFRTPDCSAAVRRPVTPIAAFHGPDGPVAAVAQHQSIVPLKEASGGGKPQGILSGFPLSLAMDGPQ